MAAHQRQLEVTAYRSIYADVNSNLMTPTLSTGLMIASLYKQHPCCTFILRAAPLLRKENRRRLPFQMYLSACVWPDNFFLFRSPRDARTRVRTHGTRQAVAVWFS